MAGQLFDSYSFFDGLEMEPVTQVNWSNYWRGVIPDGVVAEIGEEMRPYANSTGMYVYVSTGACIVDNHRGVNSALKMMAVNTADATYDRIDLLVARVVYGNENESYMELDILTGTPAIDPVAPELTQSTGDIYEIALAEIYVAANVVTLEASTVADMRNVFTAASQSISFINDDEVDLTKGMLVWLSRDNEGAVKRCPAEKVPIGVVTSDSIPVGSRGQIATVSGRIAEIACTEAAVKLGDALIPSETAGIAKVGAGYAGGLALEGKESGAVGNVKALLTVLSGKLPIQNSWYLVDGITEADVIGAWQFVDRSSEDAALVAVNDTEQPYVLTKSGAAVTWAANSGFYIPTSTSAGLNNTTLNGLYNTVLSAAIGYNGPAVYAASAGVAGGVMMSQYRYLALMGRYQTNTNGYRPVINASKTSNATRRGPSKAPEAGVLSATWGASATETALYYDGVSQTHSTAGDGTVLGGGSVTFGQLNTQTPVAFYMTAAVLYSVALTGEQHTKLAAKIKALGGMG